jgi:hypothetical protein
MPFHGPLTNLEPPVGFFRIAGERHPVHRQIAGLGCGRHGNGFSKLIGTGHPQSAGRIFFQTEDEGSAIGVAASPGVPVPVGDRGNAGIILRQTQQGRIDRLFFGGDQADLNLAIEEGKHLRPQHRGIGDSHELELFLPGHIAGNDKEPGPVGGAVNVRGLDGSVDSLFFFREAVKIQFGCGGQGLDDVF